MKRFHIHIGVKNIEESIPFYSTLFGQKPTKVKEDYAKWMLDDPKINFAISTRTMKTGIDHLGLQVDEESSLTEIKEKLKKADLQIYDEGTTTCCYAHSSKAWVKDPTGIAWEAYHSMSDAETFHSQSPKTKSHCCVPNQNDRSQQKEKCC
ncbi:MAG: glyoxalase/bleomycin resistance/dioxygenase family protein [Bdellovibrionaceae bacterium]|nr:glyoxalase/bleomycin resistance/dioxygenase family protein [Pseudobdellovibrionaceae bacterium]